MEVERRSCDTVRKLEQQKSFDTSVRQNRGGSCRKMAGTQEGEKLMRGEEDWIVEEDGLPPSNSDLALTYKYDAFGNPVLCCETVEQPPVSPKMGDLSGSSLLGAHFYAVIAVLALIVGFRSLIRRAKSK